MKLEGALLYSPSQADSAIDLPDCQKRKFVFYSSSISIAVAPPSENRSFSPVFHSQARRRPSLPILVTSSTRRYPFRFELPRGSRPGEEIPPTFPSMTTPGSQKIDGPATDFQVAYMVTASWESSNELEDRRVYVLLICYGYHASHATLCSRNAGLVWTHQFYFNLTQTSNHWMEYQENPTPG
jgi:hypothetical protein